MIRVGMIGFSEANGHPFSFSAIINGYSDEGFERAGWPVIHAYLCKRGAEEFGFEGVRVTHAWTQQREITEKLAGACRIDQVVDDAREMLGQVDAVIVARDDVESHFRLARLFLEAGLPVFVDKPLSVDPEELVAFRPYLETAQLMSCSGLRFAAELDEARRTFNDYGPILRIDGVVVNGWQTYGVHMLDAAFSVTPARPVAVQRLPASHDCLAITMDDESLLVISALGAVEPVFDLSIHGARNRTQHSLRDNFSAFRRTLAAFVGMVRTRRPAIPPRDTLLSMGTIMAGLAAEPGGKPVPVQVPA